MTPVARIIRTVVQVVIACATVVPLVVALLHEMGVAVDGPRLVAIAAAAVGLVTGAQNALEQAGLIPTLGEPRPQVGEPIDGAPLYTQAEIARALGRHIDIPAAQAVLDALDGDGT